MVREHPLLEFAFCKIFDGIFVTVSYYPQPNGPFADKNPNEREAIRSFVCIEIKVLQIVTFLRRKKIGENSNFVLLLIWIITTFAPATRKFFFFWRVNFFLSSPMHLFIDFFLCLFKTQFTAAWNNATQIDIRIDSVSRYRWRHLSRYSHTVRYRPRIECADDQHCSHKL